MDRNGKLPTKGTILAPMLQDILTSMYDSYQENIRSEARQIQTLASMSSAMLTTPPMSSPATSSARLVEQSSGGDPGAATTAPDLALPQSNAANSAAAKVGGGGLTTPPTSPTSASSAAALRPPLALTSPPLGSEAGASSFHSSTATAQASITTPVSSSLFPLSSPTPSGTASNNFPTKVDLSTTAARAALLGVTESDLKYCYRLIRYLVDATFVARDCIDVISCGILRKMIPPLTTLATLDLSLALHTCTLGANIAGTPESRVVLSSHAEEWYDLVLRIAKSFIFERRVVHLALMTLSNLTLCDGIQATTEQLADIVALIMPYYTEGIVVEAWCCVLCNITAIHPVLVKEFIRLGVVETLHRILLFLGDDAKVVTRGLQCLSNLSCPSTD